MIVHEWFTQYLALTGSGHIGNAWQCPAHDDASPSLTVTEGRDGRVLLHCHAGCAYDEVVAALALPRWIWRMVPQQTPQQWLEAADATPTYPQMVKGIGLRSGNCHEVSREHHVYVPDQVRLERVRLSGGGKRIRWERRVGKYWEYLHGEIRLVDLPLYRRAYVRQAIALREPIVLCESESSVDALIDAGIYATTWAGGAANPNIPRLRANLGGTTVVWIPDNDIAGRNCSTTVIDGLGDACDLRILWPAEGQDARDLLASLGSEQMAVRVAGATSAVRTASPPSSQHESATTARDPFAPPDSATRSVAT